MRFLFVLFFIVCGLSLYACADAPKQRTIVVLKLDDLRPDRSLDPGWRETFEFLDSEKVIGSVGLIGSGLESPKQESLDWLLARDASGHEIWNHGWCHCRETVDGVEIREFRGTDFNTQSAAILDTQKLAKEKLGLTLTAFGTPYNSSDASTAQALALASELTVWMFKDTDALTNMRILPRNKTVKIEYPVHIPDYEAFRTAYDARDETGVLTLQGHPNSWDNHPERFENFKKIVLHLKRDGVIFMTPSNAAKL